MIKDEFVFNAFFRIYSEKSKIPQCRLAIQSIHIYRTRESVVKYFEVCHISYGDNPSKKQTVEEYFYQIA